MMIKKVVLACAISFSSFLYAQEKPSVDSYIREGIELHDQGKYKLAIAKYNKALKKDKHNIQAMAEKAFSLYASKQYVACITLCQKIIDVHPNSPLLKTVYTTYANALDISGKPKQAIKVYEKAIKKFPDDYLLPFNMGITLIGKGKYDKAEMSFRNAAKANPYHASSSNALGVLMMEEHKIPALMAYSHFLSLETSGKRAVDARKNVEHILWGNIKQESANEISISLDEGVMDKEKRDYDFGTVEMTLSLMGAMRYSEENEGKNIAQHYADSFDTMVEILDKKKKGFYNTFYGNYFRALKEKGYTEVFAYLVFATSDDKEVHAWLEIHESEIRKFYKWSKSFEWKK